jgi:hypothetical protein
MELSSSIMIFYTYFSFTQYSILINNRPLVKKVKKMIFAFFKKLDQLTISFIKEKLLPNLKGVIFLEMGYLFFKRQ